MATNIRLKSSAVAGKTPTLSDLSLRELAVNTVDGKLFLRKGTGIGTDTIRDLSDHGSIDGLADDDHLQYIHTTNTRTGVTAEFNTTGKITTTNNVGIGTTFPTKKLHVVGDILIEGSTDSRFTGTWTNFGAGDLNQNTARIGANSLQFLYTFGSSIAAANFLDFMSLTNPYQSLMRLDLTSMFVGIGTESPTEKLHVSGNAIIEANSSTNALRITQTGTGNALVVEDSTNPDSTPFVVTATGAVVIGNNQPLVTYDGYASWVSVLVPTGNDSALVFRGNNGSTTSGTAQTLRLLVGGSGSSASGTILAHDSNDGTGTQVRRNNIRFYDTGISFEQSNNTDVLTVDTINARVGIGTTTPTEKLDVNGKIKTNDSVIISDSELKTTTTTRTSSSAQFTADSFSATAYRSTKYLVEVRETSTSNFYTTEILLMHDGTEVYMTQYGTLQTNVSPVSSIDSDINSGNVRLLITPSVANTTTKISRISLTA